MKSILMLLVNPSMVLSAVRSKAVVLFLLTCCLLLIQLWESVIVKVANHMVCLIGFTDFRNQSLDITYNENCS